MTKHCKYQCFLTKFFFGGGCHIHNYISMTMLYPTFSLGYVFFVGGEGVEIMLE